jgi:uncharacterized alkaline shock family protein YloU
MAENKQYITQNQENGTVLISDDVIGAIVVSSLKDVEGVIGIGGKLGFDLASIKNWAKALRINIADENSVTIDCNIIVAYGQSVILVAKNAQDAITMAIESMTGVKPAAVNINVSGIARQ